MSYEKLDTTITFNVEMSAVLIRVFRKRSECFSLTGFIMCLFEGKHGERIELQIY